MYKNKIKHGMAYDKEPHKINNVCACALPTRFVARHPLNKK